MERMEEGITAPVLQQGEHSSVTHNSSIGSCAVQHAAAFNEISNREPAITRTAGKAVEHGISGAICIQLENCPPALQASLWCRPVQNAPCVLNQTRLWRRAVRARAETVQDR